jgi:hypothetical protein
MAKFFGVLAIVALAFGSNSAAQAVNLKQKPLIEYIQYTSVPGYFLQDLNTTNTSTFDFVRNSIPMARKFFIVEILILSYRLEQTLD